MTHQLQAGTYCKFDTAKECQVAFERAKELGFNMYIELEDYDTILLHVKSGSIGSFEDDTKEDNGFWGLYNEIPTSEFLARMENKLEKPQLTLPQAIAKLEAEGWVFKANFRSGSKRDKNDLCWFSIEYLVGEWQVEAIRVPSYKFPTAASELQTAIDACELLNNAKPE